MKKNYARGKSRVSCAAHFRVSYTEYLADKLFVGSNYPFNMAANVRSLIIDLFESPDGTVHAILIATVIVVLTTGLCFKYS